MARITNLLTIELSLEVLKNPAKGKIVRTSANVEVTKRTSETQPMGEPQGYTVLLAQRKIKL